MRLGDRNGRIRWQGNTLEFVFVQISSRNIVENGGEVRANLLEHLAWVVVPPAAFEQSLDGFLVEPVLDDLRRVASDDRIRWDIFSDSAVGRQDRSRADGDSHGDGDVVADPYVMPERRVRLVGWGVAGRELSDSIGVEVLEQVVPTPKRES